jgi:transposase
LADDQVVTYTQARIDWKYALHLGLTESGIDPSVFGDFRQRLLNHRAAMKMFNRLMSRLMDLESGFSWNNLNAVNGALKIQRPFI